MAKQRGSRGDGRGGRAGGRSSNSSTFSSAAYTSNNASNRSDKPKRRSGEAPKSLHDVYDFAVASTSSSSANKGKSARRATAGMHEEDYADLPSKAKAKAGKRTSRDHDADQEIDSEDEDEDDEDDGARKPIGPKVFESEDELNAGIEGSDEDIDSDEAFGESDEEKFEGWTFGRSNAKQQSEKRSSHESDDDQESEDEQDQDDADDGMMDLSRMLDSGSDSEHEPSGQAEEEDDDDDDEQDTSKLQKHIESFAASSKRPVDADSDEDAKQGNSGPASKRTRRILTERTEAIPETEFAASGSSSALRLEDFMSPLSTDVGFADVRKKTQILGNKRGDSKNGQAPIASKAGGGALAAPLPSVVKDRLDRQGAYSMTKDEVAGWQPTIDKIRQAEHLSFPLQKPSVVKPSTAGLVASFTPSNEMEAGIAAMLQEGGLTEQQLQHQEDLAMNKLDPKEARARRDELRRMRMLMFRAEQKAKRVSKIKSKTYRKVLRKEKEKLKQQMKELGGDQDDEGLDSEEEMEERLKAERDRAKERATLKHKNTSKWAKNILSSRHGEHNQDARNELEEQLRRGEELRQKIQGRDAGDSSEDDDDDQYSQDGDGEDADPRQVAQNAFDELATLEAKEEAKRRKDEQEFEKVGGKKGVFNMKFMKDARERDYARIREDVDDFVAEMQQLGADEDDDEQSEQEAETLHTRRNKQSQDTGSATYVNGNKGRAMYGAGSITASSSGGRGSKLTPMSTVTEHTIIGDDSEDDTTAKGGSSSSQLRGSQEDGAGKARSGSLANGVVEIGGEAQVTKSGSKKGASQPLVSGAPSSRRKSNDNADAESSNPWLSAPSSSTASSSKLSKKKNESKVTRGTTSAADSAAKSAVRASKQAAKSSEALASRRADETVDIDISAHLGDFEEYNDDDGTGEVDEDGDAIQPQLVTQSNTKPSGKKGKASRGEAGAFSQRDLVSAAFAGDDVVSAFEAEKEAVMQADESKVVDTSMPGWGSWGGAGLKPKRQPDGNSRNTLRKIQGIDREARKDASMKHVIINERRDKKMDKYRVKDLPHPYTSVAQYQAAMQNPLGPEWNTRIETNRLNMPRVTKRIGKVIEPIQRKF